MRVQGSGVRVQGVGCGIQGLEFRVSRKGLRKRENLQEPQGARHVLSPVEVALGVGFGGEREREGERERQEAHPPHKQWLRELGR